MSRRDDELARLAAALLRDTIGMGREHYVNLCNSVADALILPRKQRETFLERCDAENSQR